MDVRGGSEHVDDAPDKSLATGHQADCSSCTACSISLCPEELPRSSDGRFTGWRFALVSVGLFLTPVLLAIGGAIYGADAGIEGQFVGALIGLSIGMGGAVVVGRK